MRLNPDGSGDQSFGNESIDGSTTLPRGRLRVFVPNQGFTSTLEAGHILVRPNGRINLLGTPYNPFGTRAIVSQQNTSLTGTFSSDVSAGTNIQTVVNDVSVTFAVVTVGGQLTTTTIDPNSAGPPPANYTIPPETPAYEVTTTASYLPPVDVCVTVPLANDQAQFNKLRLLHGENGTLLDRTTSQNFQARQVCGRVNSLSPFVIGVSNSTTASGVTVSGRVQTSYGRGVTNARVQLTDSAGQVRTAITGRRGTFIFEDISSGETYVASVTSRRFSFVPRVIHINNNVTGLDFTPEESRQPKSDRMPRSSKGGR